MESIFKTILITSLYASIVGILILIIKTMLRNRINPKLHYIIWLVLVLKLVIPFGPGSIISLFNTVPQVSQNIDFSHDYETYHKSVESFRLDNPEIPFGMQVKDTTLSIAALGEKVLPYLWVIGAAAMLGWLLYTNFSLYKKIGKTSTAIPQRLYSILEKCKKQFDISMDIPIVIQKIIKTPAIFGIIKPRILVSPDILNLSEKDISYIFLHELAHYQRKDTAANYILLALQTIHWFNPIIWFCFKKIRQDMEVAADEKVLGLLEGKEQKEYGKALLLLLERCSAAKLAPRLIGMVDDKKNIERRIRMIKMAEFFKSKRKMAVLTGILCVTLLCM
jgi:bla regulator protein BlaR1